MQLSFFSEIIHSIEKPKPDSDSEREKSLNFFFSAIYLNAAKRISPTLIITFS